MLSVKSSMRSGMLRRRAGAALAAIGALVLSSGLVMVSAPAAVADGVAVCHATNSDVNPYNSIAPAQSSSHDSSHDATWGKDGAWWHGQWRAPNSAKPELYSGAVPPGADPEAYCSEQATKGPRTATPSVTWVEPGCANGNTGSWTASTEGVTYAPASGSAAPGQTATVTATAQTGYEFAGKKTSATLTHSFGAGESCVGAVSPEAPTVSQPACTGPGTSTPLSVDLASTDDVGYGYDADTLLVTATADAGHEFVASLPDGWTRVSDTTATYAVPLTPAGACLWDARVEEPSATGATCADPGALVLPSGTGYHWTGDTAGGAGDHTVTAAADAGYQLVGRTSYTWTVPVPAAGEGLTCADPATPAYAAEPTWTEPTCTTSAAVSYTAADGVSYTTEGTVAPGERVVVTGHPVGNRYLDGDFWWAHTFGPVPTGCEGTKPATGTIPDEVTPDVVTPDEVTPDEVTPDEVTEPDQVTDPENGPEPVILGEEEIRTLGTDGDRPRTGPKTGPARAPVVRGTQIAVPTVVAAGLPGAPSATTLLPPVASSIPQLAQALVAGGLVMLVAGGWLGLGRRTRGARES